MKMQWVHKVLCVLLLSLAGSTMASTMIVKDASKAINISKQQSKFTVRLPANATTGYSWVLNGDYDQDLIKPVEHQYIAPDKKLLGAPGTSEWTFQLQAKAFKVPTKITVTLDYMRPWEKAVSKTQTLTVITH